MRKKVLATVSLSGTLAEKLSAAANAGFDGVEVFENDLIGSPLRPREVRDLADQLGLTIDLYQPFRDFEGVTPDVLSRNLERAERKFDLMRELGAELLLVCSNVASAVIDDAAVVADQLRELAERAGARGLRIAYEALAWGKHVNTYAHAWRAVEMADHPQLGVCLDSFHILSRGDEPAGIREIPGEKIFFVQLADAPQLLMDVLQWSRHYRSFPGQGALDLTSFLGHVLDAGYAGPLSLEVFNDVFRQADPARVATDAMRSLLALESAVDPAGSELPELAQIVGCDGVEIVAEDEVAGTGTSLLAALGFTRTDSASATWCNGSAEVTVGPRPAVEGGARVAMIGLATSNPAALARRARALSSPVRVAVGRPPEIQTPDGTTISVRAAGRTQSMEGSGPITSIDHVALSQPFDYFDEATLFYRAVLGFELEPSQELAAPRGLIRSRAVAAADRSVRIVLNVPALGGGPSDVPEHIAFGSTDVFAAAHALRDAGIAVLPISDNYYDDLEARLDLSVELLERMRRLYVLYDRTENGEFFHFYTQSIGSRLFFEVLQRVGGYAGYGASNSAVRLAAQRHLPTDPSLDRDPRPNAVA